MAGSGPSRPYYHLEVTEVEILLEPMELGADLDAIVRPKGYIICDTGYKCASGQVK